jgi:hypothetical protein
VNAVRFFHSFDVSVCVFVRCERAIVLTKQWHLAFPFSFLPQQRCDTAIALYRKVDQLLCRFDFNVPMTSV